MLSFGCGRSSRSRAVRGVSGTHTAFPDFPPYGGAFTEIVQHLTIGADGNRTRSGCAERRGPATDQCTDSCRSHLAEHTPSFPRPTSASASRPHAAGARSTSTWRVALSRAASSISAVATHLAAGRARVRIRDRGGEGRVVGVPAPRSLRRVTLRRRRVQPTPPVPWLSPTIPERGRRPAGHQLLLLAVYAVVDVGRGGAGDPEPGTGSGCPSYPTGGTGRRCMGQRDEHVVVAPGSSRCASRIHCAPVRAAWSAWSTRWLPKSRRVPPPAAGDRGGGVRSATRTGHLAERPLSTSHGRSRSRRSTVGSGTAKAGADPFREFDRTASVAVEREGLVADDGQAISSACRRARCGYRPGWST